MFFIIFKLHNSSTLDYIETLDSHKVYFFPFLRGVDPRPPGGSLNCLHDPSNVLPQQPLNQHTMAQNFHFVGGPLPSAPFPAPQPSVFRGIPSPSLAKERTPLQTSHSQRAINLDSGDEDGDVRTEKRLAWTKDEDERLVTLLCTIFGILN
jgi:hypothetical protein